MANRGWQLGPGLTKRGATRAEVRKWCREGGWVRYFLQDPRQPGAWYYCGITCRPDKRYYEHMHPRPNDRTATAQRARELIQMGMRPLMYVFDLHSTEQDAAQWERAGVEWLQKNTFRPTNELLRIRHRWF